MKAVRISMMVAIVLVTGSALALAAPINPFNNRPVPIGSSWDAASICQPFGAASCETQDLMNFLGFGSLNAVTSQQAAGMWYLDGPFRAAIPVFSIEITSNAGTQQLGIWSDSNMDTDNDGRVLVDIFLGSAAGAPTPYYPTVASLTFNLALGTMTITQAGGPAGSVNQGTFTGISPSAFGFYLQPQGDSGPTWYSLDQLNPNGTAQMVAYQLLPQNRWLIGFEDIENMEGGGTDRDFNDAMFTIESMLPVPEPASLILLGSGLLGLGILARRRRK